MQIMEVLTMKKRFMAYAAAILAALSCSSAGRLQTQSYDDGIYTRPAVPAPVYASNDEVDNLLADTQQSPAYILSNGDTLVVPAGTKLKFSSESSIFVVDNTPAWVYDYSWRYYDPRYYDYYYWHRPWHYYGYSPWYYNSWYYDPWYFI